MLSACACVQCISTEDADGITSADDTISSTGYSDLTDKIRPVKAHRDLKSVIMQDQSCVDASKLALGHPERY